MRFLSALVPFLICYGYCYGQHSFSGQIDNERWQNSVYLSVIDDYRTFYIINDEQIISKVQSDASGHFSFVGDQLDPIQKIYKLHVDNCSPSDAEKLHFEGHCSDSKDILFIAKNTDTINFPLSFDAEMFCDIISNNPKTAAFIKIDSLKEEMKFAYSEFRSKANRNLNNKKWFKTLQDFGTTLNEPLAELYIYAFLSERSSPFHDYYLEDLKDNAYYDALLKRLETHYPSSTYAQQYKMELASDRYVASPPVQASNFNWTYLLGGLLVASLVFNLLFILNRRRRKSKAKDIEQLTKQEQNVLQLLLDDHSNKAIADTLFVSVSTVKTHVNNVYKKLNVNSRDELKSLYNK